MLKINLMLCLFASAFSGCESFNDRYKAPPENVPQAGMKKLVRGEAIIDGVPAAAGIARVSHVEGQYVRYRSKDFDELVKNPLLERHHFIGISTGLTELNFEFLFKTPDGSGYLCSAAQLVEIEEGRLYAPAVLHDEDNETFTCWIIDVNTGETVSEKVEGEWKKLKASSFQELADDWLFRTTHETDYSMNDNRMPIDPVRARVTITTSTSSNGTTTTRTTTSGD
ncbi:hypothetical protein [Pelagicoccus mobilis]|uniref:Lipoprotein n=1 Tax=Pelagicoccus mobilis TaxID=415221 RepID=A0A934VPR8_9BACT|nr:hypothetical protein [Pelagicoccus mobilis]MBK1875813.1 hypothetical protein [Pelagicoccus mobilis]